MKINEKYKITFDLYGLLLFLLIMLPNFIWFVIPAPNDILRIESITPGLDITSSFFQVMMVIALCFIANKERQKPMDKLFVIAIIITVSFYFLGWVFYYNGFAGPVVILTLCIVPCLSFIIFSVARKNIFSLIFSTIFMVCHFIYTFMNFTYVFSI